MAGMVKSEFISFPSLQILTEIRIIKLIFTILKMLAFLTYRYEILKEWNAVEGSQAPLLYVFVDLTVHVTFNSFQI